MSRKVRSHRPSPALAVALLALFVSLGGVGYSATGGTFILGRSNTAANGSSLTANIGGKTLSLKNTSTASGASALNLNVAAGKPPLTTNSGTKVANLNADKLDGLNSTAFLGAGATAADSQKLGGFDWFEFLGATAQAADSNKLDGLDSSEFLAADATAADSDKLDGLDSKAFARLGGVVNGDGTIVQGTGFTVTKLGEGEYQVSFPGGTLSNANCPPIATVTAVTAGTERIPLVTGRTCSGLGAGSFTVKIVDVDSAAHDTPFVFLAM